MTPEYLSKSRIARRRTLALLGGVAAAGLLPARTARAADKPASALVFDGDALIAATGDEVWRHDRSGGAAARLSTPGAPVRALACHPGKPGRLFASPEGGGVLRSDNGGHSWRPASGGLPQASVTTLTIAAGAPDTVYAAVAEDGIWRSEDAGETWALVMDRPWIAKAKREVLTLASVNLASGMGGIWLYAGTAKGLTRVPDCFCRWQDVVAGDAMDALVARTPPAPEAPLPKGEPVLALVSAHRVPERLYAALPAGVWASADGGVTWARRSNLRATALAADPEDPGHVVAATDTDLTESRDGGASWAALAAL